MEKLKTKGAYADVNYRHEAPMSSEIYQNNWLPLNKSCKNCESNLSLNNKSYLDYCAVLDNFVFINLCVAPFYVDGFNSSTGFGGFLKQIFYDVFPANLELPTKSTIFTTVMWLTS